MAIITINTAEELFNIGIDVATPIDGDYVLGQDIDCSAHVDTEAIGSNGDVPFTGTFDGNNHKISNMTIAQTDARVSRIVGLFAVLGAGAVVKNIVFESCTITNTRNTATTVSGLIAGSCIQLNATVNPSIITDCSATDCSISANAIAGGLVGNVKTSDLSNLETPLLQMSKSSFSGTVETRDIYSVAMGGLIAEASRVEMSKCYALGTITTSNYFVNCWIGGLIGQAFDSLRMINCYCQMNIDVQTDYNTRIGGLICRIFSGVNTEITNCYTANTFPRAVVAKAGGMCFLFGDITEPELYVTDCHWDSDISGVVTRDELGVTGQTTSLMQNQDTFENWDFVSIWGILSGNYPNFDLAIIAAPEPFLLLEYKNNNVGNWSTPRFISLGKTGDASLIKSLRRLGSYETRQYRLTWIVDVPMTLALFQELVEGKEEDTDGS